MEPCKGAHSIVYMGGEARCMKCYAEILPSGPPRPWKGKGKPPFIQFIEKLQSKTPNPMKKKTAKTPRKKSIPAQLKPWNDHVKAVRKANPWLTYKQALIKAKKSF